MLIISNMAYTQIKTMDKLNLFQTISSNTFYYNAQLSEYSEHLTVKTPNLGLQLDYGIGLGFEKVWLKLNMGGQAVPLNFFVDTDADYYHFTYTPKVRDFNYKFSVNLGIETGTQIKLSPIYNLNLSGILEQQMFLSEGLLTGVSYGEIDASGKDVSIYEANIPIQSITKKRFSHLKLLTGLSKEVKNNELTFNLIFNYSFKPIFQGDLTFFEDEAYQENVEYKQAGHYWGVGISYTFK